jgi:hypothetical protein
MNLTEFRQTGCLDELARLFDREAAVRALLLDAEVPAERLPPFGQEPLFYWMEVCRRIDDGLSAEGLNTLLRAALRHYPHNPVLQAAVRGPGPSGPPGLHLTVRRAEGGGFVLAATTRTATGRATRNMGKRVPPAPERVRLRTGDVVKVEVESERSGYVTVFNIGPTDHLTVLYPEAGAGPIEAGHPLEVLEVEMQPPAGRERLFALWTAKPLALDEKRLRALAAGQEAPPSPTPRAMRDRGRKNNAVPGLRAEEWAAALLEVEHWE